MVLTGERNMRRFHMLQVIHGLKLEVNTGMKLSSRGSVLKVAQNMYGCQSRTKAGALAEMEALLAAMDAEG
jgi:hypothetical protein